jgi:hypothetical protein
VNQIGVSKRSFVFDNTYDYEVWNQPVYSYQYSYFHPQTLLRSSTLMGALIDRRRFANDRFARYRSPRASYLVGIAMQVVYVAETLPNHIGIDTPAQDKRIAVNFLYDLELDDQFKIIGGEWYNRFHPDFLWVHPKNSRPVTVGDTFLNRPENAAQAKWTGSQPMPALWTQAAVASSQQGQPLEKIVQTLVNLSAL